MLILVQLCNNMKLLQNQCQFSSKLLLIFMVNMIVQNKLKYKYIYKIFNIVFYYIY